MTEKAIVSNRIYFKYKDKDHLKDLMKILTYRIEGKKKAGKNPFTDVEIIKNYKLYPGDIIAVPQGRTDLIPEGYQIVDKRIIHEAPFPEPKFSLREGQLEVYNKVEDTCFINALVGWGKTFTALHLARKLGQKTLVITHTTALRDQWIEEIRDLFGMEPGVIGSGKFDIEDRAIVVGNIQTITKNIPTLCKEFGTIILDEAHHCPATTFSAAVDGMYARYRIALSGTMQRTDGKHVIFQDYFGFDVLKPPQSHTLNPTIKVVSTGMSLPSGLTWVQKVNSIMYDEDYQEFIATLAKIQIAKGHKVLVIADRVEFLTNVKELLGDSCVLITGETPFEERKALINKVEYGETMCIAGSIQLFSEGISVNPLSCVILTTLTSNPITLEQVIGRIMRLHEGKLDPEVMDITFSSYPERKQAEKRIEFYESKGWNVVKI